MKKTLLQGEIGKTFDVCLTGIREHRYTIERLTKELRHFEGELDRQLETNRKILDSKVRQLISDARAFLKLCQTNGSEDYVPYCLAAVDYLVDSNDAVPDFADYDGFDDDREVFAAVIKMFSLEATLQTKVA